MIIIAMIDDGINGRLPYAMEATPDGKNKPGETLAQYEVRMAYHEGVIFPNYPMPALFYEVGIEGHMVHIDVLVCLDEEGLWYFETVYIFDWEDM